MLFGLRNNITKAVVVIIRSFTGEMSAVNINKNSVIIDTTYKSAVEVALEIVKIVRSKL